MLRRVVAPTSLQEQGRKLVLYRWVDPAVCRGFSRNGGGRYPAARDLNNFL